MGDLIQIQAAGDIAPESEDAALLSVTNKLLLDDRLSVLNEKTMSVPIAELATLGAGVSSPDFVEIRKQLTDMIKWW